MIINIKINLRVVIKVCSFVIDTFFMKSAETCAFKKKALGIAKKATKAIPNSTISIVPATGELKNQAIFSPLINGANSNSPPFSEA